MELANSKRILRSATYVAVEHSDQEQERIERRSGRPFDKLNFLRDIKITLSQVEAFNIPEGGIAGLTAHEARAALTDLAYLARHIEQVDAPVSNLTLAPRAARVPAPLIVAIANTMYNGDSGMVLTILMFQKKLKTAPIGRLHLERIEMYPAGIQRGELVFTVPLAPKETVTISHKEWSTAGQEYETIVQDYFESYSERGVAEKTDVSMSTENESKHASAFNFSASAAGGYGPVAMTVAVGLTQTAEDRQSQKQSTQRTREVTEKASARTRQEHKVSAKLETKRGVEDSSFRTITNPSDTKAIRIDYYRLMRKWRTDLYRYGLRLTFDIAVPNPGARLWALYRRVRWLDELMRKPFAFPLEPQDVTETNWPTISAQYSVIIDPPPPPMILISISRTLQDPKGGMEIFDFVAPAGYHMQSDTVKCDGLWFYESAPDSIIPPPSEPPLTFPPDTTMSFSGNPGNGSFTIQSKGFGGGPHASWFLGYPPSNRLVLSALMNAKRDEATLTTWQTKSWTALRDRAFANFQETNARRQAERDQLWLELAGKDTLTLRRLEREELIRQTLLWIMGVSFDPTPPAVGQVIRRLVDMEQYQLDDDDPFANILRTLSQSEWATAAGFGDFVKYIHNAVEWENLLYFIYPYFWGSDDVAREKMLFDHPDTNHREFLRAGYARVVVPIRPGFEESFTELLETGVFSGAGSTPYITIAQEVAAFARTNYAGVPPANPEKHSRPLLYPEQRTTWETMQGVIKALEAYRDQHNVYPSDLSALPGGSLKDAWSNEFIYKNPGTGNDYDLVSLGADGAQGGEGVDADISAGAAASLIASWFDYTPTSGIDITIDSPLQDVA